MDNMLLVSCMPVLVLKMLQYRPTKFSFMLLTINTNFRYSSFVIIYFLNSLRVFFIHFFVLGKIIKSHVFFCLSARGERVKFLSSIL